MGHSSILGSSATIVLAVKIMVISIIVLLLVAIFVMFLHLYAKWHWWHTEVPEEAQQQRRRRLVFVPEEEMGRAVTLRRGLDLAVLKSLPIRVFHVGDDFGSGIDNCAVCLCELVEGEKAKVLPKCNHAFHVDCIDMWFRSHATCPLCRNLVAVELARDMIMVRSESFHSVEEESQVMNPTDAFSTGEGASSSSAASSLSTDRRMVVIDIPCLSPSPSLCSLDDMLSTANGEVEVNEEEVEKGQRDTLQQLQHLY